MRPYPLSTSPRPPDLQHLRLSVDVAGGRIGVAGDLDRASAHHLTDALSALRSSPAQVWTLDLDGVSFCDVEGLRVLTAAAALADSCDRGLHLTRIPSALADLLALYRAARVAHRVPLQVTRTPVAAAAC